MHTQPPHTPKHREQYPAQSTLYMIRVQSSDAAGIHEVPNLMQ